MDCEQETPDLGPIFCRPDPEKLFFVAAKPKKLVRRGPRKFFLVGIRPDGERVEAQLGAATLQMST
jgi:hypothetical protein